MENLINILPEFLKDFNLVYVIGIVSAILSALWAYRKFLYEKQLEKFKDANINLFKTDKQEVLAAIATLAFFNRDRKFRQNTIDILLSRLYTELDYDITNAIASALIQYSSRGELKYIADELLGINRNFFLQTYPIEQMIGDLKRNWNAFKELEHPQLPEAETASDSSGQADLEKIQQARQPAGEVREIEKDNSIKIKQKLRLEYQRLYPKYLYELTWHKQITGDTYSRIMRKATTRESKLLRRQKKLEMRLYQNDFNYTHMAKINISKCTIDNSAISSAILSDVAFSNISYIKDSTFSVSSFRNCAFEKGKIVGSSFIDCAFKNVVFKEILFDETVFWGSRFFNCWFIDCENINPVIFYQATFKDTKMPWKQSTLAALKNTDAYAALEEYKVILNMRKDEMKIWLDTYFPQMTARIARIENDFSIDEIENEIWETAETIKVDKYWSGETAPEDRSFKTKLLWSDSALYVRFEANQAERLIVSDEPNLETETLGLWERDVCEIFVAPKWDEPQKYFEFEIAPNGEWVDLAINQTDDRRDTDFEYDSGMQKKTVIKKDKVLMAIKIDWKAFGKTPKPGNVWRGNLFRCVGAGITRGYLAWQPTKTPEPAFHIPEAFGEFEFME